MHSCDRISNLCDWHLIRLSKARTENSFIVCGAIFPEAKMGLGTRLQYDKKFSRGSNFPDGELTILRFTFCGYCVYVQNARSN